MGNLTAASLLYDLLPRRNLTTISRPRKLIPLIISLKCKQSKKSCFKKNNEIYVFSSNPTSTHVKRFNIHGQAFTLRFKNHEEMEDVDAILLATFTELLRIALKVNFI